MVRRPGEAERARIAPSNAFWLSRQSDMWKWQPLPVRRVNGFGMKVAIILLLGERVHHVRKKIGIAADERCS